MQSQSYFISKKNWSRSKRRINTNFPHFLQSFPLKKESLGVDAKPRFLHSQSFSNLNNARR